MITPSGLNRFQKATATQAGEQCTGSTVEIGGKCYNVAAVVTRGVLRSSDGGYVQARTLDMIARDEVLPLRLLVDQDSSSEPVKRTIVTHNGIEFMVQSVVTDPTGFQHHITAVEKDSIK